MTTSNHILNLVALKGEERGVREREVSSDVQLGTGDYTGLAVTQPRHILQKLQQPGSLRIIILVHVDPF